MYKKLEKFLIVLSVLLVIFFSLFIVISKHKQMFAGADGGVLVLKAKNNIKESINDIAEEKNVLIAKQIMVPSTDGKSDNQPTFQKFGKGELPIDFPEQLNKVMIDNSNDSVNYFIFGKKLSSNSLSKYLNSLGNETIVADNDWRFQGIISILDFRIIIGVLLFVIAYMALLMADFIINLKKQGIQRLAGISNLVLAFSGMKKRIIYIFVATVVGLILSSLILYILNLKRLMYFYVIIFPALFWIITLIILELLVGIFVYLFLQKQKINLVIKDRAPVNTLMNFVFFLQLISLLCLIFSFSTIQSLNKEIGLLDKAKKNWASQEYYSPSLLTGNVEKYRENLSNFLVKANEKEELLLVADNFNNNLIESQYLPTIDGNENVLYVTPNYIDKVGIDIDHSLFNNSDTDFTILIPKSQKSKEKELSSAWLERLNSTFGTSLDLKVNSAIYKMPTQELFTFRIFGWSAVDSRSFVKEPVIIVMSTHVFNNKNIDSGSLFSWISREQFLFSNNKITKELISEYGLESILGSFSNGNYSVSIRLMEKKVQQTFMIISSSIALLSATFLFFLMNRIYLYQNRKKFAVCRISGKSVVDTHKTYLVQILFILVLSISMIFIMKLNPSTFIIPFAFLGIQLFLFVKQVNKNKSTYVSILKGE